MKYYCIKQHDYKDCGAACLATIAKQYGLSIPVARIRQVAGTDLLGTNVIGIVKAAEALGFEAKAVNGNRKAFLSGFSTPAIAHVTLKNHFQHYIVVHKVTKKYILIADPRSGLEKYTYDDFFDIWSGVLILMEPTSNFVKKKTTENPLIRFARLLLTQKRILGTVCLASLLITVLGILASFYFRFIMDDVGQYSKTHSLLTISLGIIFLYACQSVLLFFRSRLLQYMSQNLDIPLMLGYYNHVLRLPMDFFGTRKVGEIMSRFSDATKIRAAVSGAAMTVLIDTIMAIVGGIVLFQQNYVLFFIAFGMVLAHTIVVYSFTHPMRDVSREEMETYAQLNSYLVESLNGIETIKAYNNEKIAQHKTEHLFLQYLKSEFFGGTLASGQNALTSFISNVGLISITWVGTMMVLSGSFTFGQLITFNALLHYFTGPLQRLVSLQPTIQTALVAADRLSEVLDLEQEDSSDQYDGFTEISLKQPIIICNLNFRYGTRDLVLKGINMKIKPGERVAIVGESGSGKTTLVKLLLRFYDWEAGSIYYGDTDIHEIPRSLLRTRTAYISQENFLFSGTIKENLLFGNQQVSMAEVIEACKKSHAHEFIQKMPGKYNARLEERGENLSGGQRQRLAIARALIRKPDILIMDEATSNLDAATEKGIQQTIDTLPENITVIIIAHRLSTIKQCDTIYVMEDGVVVEQGNHQELIKNHNKYFDLWKDQFPDLPLENVDE